MYAAVKARKNSQIAKPLFQLMTGIAESVAEIYLRDKAKAASNLPNKWFVDAQASLDHIRNNSSLTEPHLSDVEKGLEVAVAWEPPELDDKEVIKWANCISSSFLSCWFTFLNRGFLDGANQVLLDDQLRPITDEAEGQTWDENFAKTLLGYSMSEAQGLSLFGKFAKQLGDEVRLPFNMQLERVVAFPGASYIVTRISN